MLRYRLFTKKIIHHITTSHLTLNPSNKHILLNRSHISWTLLSNTHRQALQLLGWNESSWNSKTSPPKLLPYDKLSSEQQAAVKYGLLLSESDWNSQLNAAVTVSSNQPEHNLPQETLNDQSKSNGSSAASSIFKFAWSAAKIVSHVAKSLPKAHPAVHVVSTALDHAPSFIDHLADRVPLSAGVVETVVYLDDSGSMTNRLTDGKRALESMRHMLQKRTRIIKFGTGKTVISMRGEEWSPGLMIVDWNATSGTTYMWKMIEDDIVNKYAPGAGKLRLIVITDGYDTESPGKYQGMRGMDPMMEYLSSAGYDIEFHIVILGERGGHRSLSAADVTRYESLAAATGGGSMVVGLHSYDERSPDVKKFLKTIERGGHSDSKAIESRKQQQLRYLNDAKSNKRIKFSWLKSLPLPKDS